MLGCGGGSPCDDVLNSRWSTIAGVLPVSGLAAGAYLAMLVCSLSLGPSNATPVRRLAWDALRVLTGTAAGSAVWFTIVQKWIVGAFCPYCMATHLTGLVLTVLVIWHALRRDDDDFTDAPVVAGVADPGAPQPGQPQRGQPPPHARTSGFRLSVVRGLSPVLVGVALAAMLVAAQTTLAPASLYRGGESRNQPAVLDPHAVPLVGSPDARHIVTLLFDYQCTHCQRLHLMLGEAVRRYEGQLAFALCPAPLNTRCNPHVPRDVAEFKDSCELARIALAVWRADRAAFPAFEDWMYTFDSGDRWRPRTVTDATTKAVELVGRAKFGTATNDPWIDRYLQASVRIYGDTMQNGVGGVPKLVFGPRWVNPQPRDAADLVSILQTGLGIPPP